MHVRVGTSGYSYPEWKGTFYPSDLPAAGMLRHYGERLDAVEINNTFYRFPTPKVLTEWAEQVPPTFSFVLKSARRITHIKRLKDAGDVLGAFFERATALGARLGPLLVQLPPNLKKDVARLTSFLEQAPKGARLALEFRERSWFDDDVTRVLAAHGAAQVWSESEELAAPQVATASWGYLRLRSATYDEAALRVWTDRLRAQAWSEAYVFFKHEDAGVGPALARKMAAMLGER